MSEELIRRGPGVPTEERALARLRRAVELGELEELSVPGILSACPRYLVTFMKSDTTTANVAMRSATAVSVTNQSTLDNRVIVMFFNGLKDDSAPDGVAALAIPPQFTVNFTSRPLPDELTRPTAVSNPPLTSHQGRAIVSATWPEIGVSARVYYTAGERDETLHAITDSKVVVYGGSNNGD